MLQPVRQQPGGKRLLRPIRIPKVRERLKYLGHFMRVKTKVDPSGGSVSSRQRMNANYAASFSQSNSTFGADLTSDEPDLAGFTKRMVRTLTRSEKNSIPYLQVVDFDRIMGQLAEVKNPTTLISFLYFN